MKNREPIALILICVLFMAVNLLTASRLPVAWNDEVMYADPAVNLALGNGFTASTWYGQDSKSFWAGNVPLHATVLAAWLRVWGVGPVSVRSFCCLLYLLGVVCVWATVKRTGWVRSPVLRLALVALLLGGYGVTFSYRSARPDALTVLIAAGLVFASTLHSRLTKRICILVCGCLSIFAGLQLVVFFCFLSLLIICFRGRQHFSEIVLLGVGVVFGGCLLYAVYRSQGVWEVFLGSTLAKHTSIGDNSIVTKLRDYHIQFGGFARDFSLLLLLALTVSLTFRQAIIGALKFRSCLVFGLCVALLIPIGLFATGVFPIYYSWMAYFPLCVSLMAVVDSDLGTLPRLWRHGVSLTLVLAGGLGLPLLTMLTLIDWDDKNPRPMEAMAAACLKPSDIVWCVPDVYYAAKSRTACVYSAMHELSPEEKQRLTVVIVGPASGQELADVYGGSWRECSSRVKPRRPPVIGTQSSVMFHKYDLQAYRRVE